MQVLPTQGELSADALRADKLSNDKDSLWVGGNYGLVQTQGQLPQPKLFRNQGPRPSHTESVRRVFNNLQKDVNDSTFEDLKSWRAPYTAEPVVHSPDSLAKASPDLSPGVQRPLEDVTSPELFNGTGNKGAAISSLVLRALEGSLSACAHLSQGHMRSQGVRPLALHRAILPMVEAGVLRARLQQFVRVHDTLVYQGSPVDATQAAFARGVDMVLRMHLVLLRTCMTSIMARRAAEAPDMDSHMPSHHPTVLELLQHTRPLREQVLLYWYIMSA